jgi:hypothetical protein
MMVWIGLWCESWLFGSCSQPEKMREMVEPDHKYLCFGCLYQIARTMERAAQ